MSKQYSIAGIPVTPSEYQRLEFVLTNEYQGTGIKPTHAIVKELIHSDRHPSKELKQDSREFDKLMRKER